MLQPQNQTQKYQDLFTYIDTGLIKIPKFQRDFVWSKEQTAKLIDSIIKGFPIGTLIFWKTREELRYVKEIGRDNKLPEIPKGDAVFYVLDGQQRITSLYAVRKGVIIDVEGREENYKDISINLALDPDDDERIVATEPLEGIRSISVFKLLNSSLVEFFDGYSRDELKKIEVYQRRLTGYDFSIIIIADYPIDIACEVFTRINTGGTELTLFEIMVAKTYEIDRFDLAEEYERLINNNGAEKDLEDANFDTIPPSTVLQCVAAYLTSEVNKKEDKKDKNSSIRRSDILKLNKQQFIDSWPIVKNGIFAAVDYIRTHLRIPVSQLLPYNALLVPLTYFFIHNSGKMPSPRQDKLLTQYFWWASLSERFSSAVESKVAEDLHRMDKILREEAPNYDEKVDLAIEKLKWRQFSTGNAFCKAIVCLYAFHQPRSFASNSLVKIDNSWLIRSNSKNYHHFFPKDYLRSQGYDEKRANVILNITIVEDRPNKKIGAKRPSQYMMTFRKDNKELVDTMKTHLIDDLGSYGVWNDDYDTFIERRGHRVLEELKKRLEPDL